MNDIFTQYEIPLIDIEYMKVPGLTESGNFDNIPRDAYGAEIYQSFPFVNAKGEYKITGIKYRLYINGIYNLPESLSPNDIVFNTYEEMVSAIKNIKETFDSIHVSFNKVEEKRIQR